jgi:UDP-N-acetylglucosamine--N-acetylmuramyl-(pentapeptide) pyrophosphoryl-undecaprenol N-acetylglucosamine transferase
MALRLYESFQPSAVIGFGGYPALPALLAAALRASPVWCMSRTPCSAG